METNIYKFSDGLRLVYSYRPYFRSVGISVLCGVGSVCENQTNNGISHFIEHMYFKGTKSRSAFQIVEEIESIGARINAFTSKENTCFYTLSLDDQVDKCVEILSDILFNPTFDEEELAREKKVVIEEINMSDDDNEGVGSDILAETFYKGYPVAMPILGSKKNVNGFTADELRMYIHDNYCSNNVVISICGNISLEKAKALVEENFVGKFNNHEKSWGTSLIEYNHSSITKFKDIAQSNITLAFPEFKYNSSDSLKASIVMELMGGGMTSRLFQEIREKQGLAYNVYTYSIPYKAFGSSLLYIGTNPDSVEKAIESSVDLIKKIKKEGFTKDEISRAKAQGTTSFAMLEESTASIMRATAKRALYSNELYDTSKIIEDMKKITYDDIQETLNKMFNLEKAAISYVGKEVKADFMGILNS